MSYGTALITDVEPNTLEDYEQNSLESLAADSANISVPYQTFTSLSLKKEMRKPGRLNFFVRLTMRMQKEEFQVYDFELRYQQSPNDEILIKFYMVPVGAYFKPRRQTQTREAILREYAEEALGIFRKVLPAQIFS
jgi:hypothetical protein